MNAEKSSSPHWLESLKKGTKWLASALFLPIKKIGRFQYELTWPRLGVFFTAWWIVQPAMTMLFPRAEDVFKEQGLNPDIVQELAPGKRVHIRHDNFLGKLHASFDQGPYLAPFTMYRHIFNDNIGGYALSTPSFVLPHLASVYVKSAASAASYAGDEKSVRRVFNKNAQYHLPITAKERYKFVLLHEVRHTSAANQSLDHQFLSESDADYHAVEILAHEEKKPFIRKNFLDFRALARGDDDHDTALYLDIKFRNAAMPAVSEMLEANKKAREIVSDMILWEASLSKGDCAKVKYARECSYDIDLQKLSPLAARRVELAAEALRDFIKSPALMQFKRIAPEQDQAVLAGTAFEAPKPPESRGRVGRAEAG